MKTASIAERRFAEADAGAEQLLGFVRMGVALLLLAALVAAFGADARPDDPVLVRRLMFALLGMGCYFAVGLAAVLLVRAGRHAPWIAWATAFADVGLISWNIYGAVHFAGVSSFFALAYPAAMMAPLALAFGALRFRPGVQLAATLMTGALITFIVYGEPLTEADREAALAQLAVAYAIPPNAIRILMILATGAVIALAVLRARRLMQAMLAEQEARANLTRFLPQGLSDDMSDAAIAALRAGRRADLAIMFADIRGFTARTETMQPEEASRFLGAHRSMVLDIAAQHGAVVDKFIGDGALLVFGLQGPPEETARAALLTARELAAGAQALGYDLWIGAHLGPVTAGAVGDERRLEFTVIGDAVNVAARVEEMTRALGAPTLITEQLWRAAGAPEDWREAGAHTIRGREAKARLYAPSSPEQTPADHGDRHGHSQPLNL